MHNHNAVRTKVGELSFDSRLEADTYSNLQTCCYLDNDLTLRVKPGLKIKPATSRIKERTWACDFRLQHPKNGFLHVEAKGVIDSSLKFYLEMLDVNYPDIYDRLIFVANEDNKKVFNFAKDYQIKCFTNHNLHSFILSDSWD